jgi:hypothetical protein
MRRSKVCGVDGPAKVSIAANKDFEPLCARVSSSVIYYHSSPCAHRALDCITHGLCEGNSRGNGSMAHSYQHVMSPSTRRRTVAHPVFPDLRVALPLAVAEVPVVRMLSKQIGST